MVLTGSVLVITLAADNLAESKTELQTDRAEKALVQFDGEAALVALGGERSSSVSLPRSGQSYQVDDSQGWLRVTATGVNGTTTTITNATLGVVRYSNGGNTIGYQGGGVWRASPSGGSMVAPPEFHYREGTLTLPIISINGSGQVSDRAQIIHQTTAAVYPKNDQPNPVRRSKFNITVQSRFYRGWGTYFAERTPSEVTYKNSQNIAHITLVPPPEPIELDSGVVAAGNLTIESNAAGITGDVSVGGTVSDTKDTISGDVNEGVPENRQLKPAHAEIEAAEDRLENESGPGSTDTIPAGAYFVESSSVFGDSTTFDTRDGDVELYVNSSISSNADVDIVGDGDVTIYTNGEFDMRGQSSWGNSSSVSSLTLYSTSVDRITEFYGVLYTGGVDIEGGGSGDGLIGALVSTNDSINITGNAEITYSAELAGNEVQDVELEFGKLTYLHITRNEIKVE